MSQWRIPLSDLDYGVEEEAAILRVLQSKLLSMGPEVEAFEREFAAMVGVKHAVAVANGTAALHLAYLALEVGSGDEVIQPAINFVAAANTAVAVGALPVFADIISLLEPTIDPGIVEAAITARSKAIVVMHYGGYPCRMGEIVDIAYRHGLAIIEDACHAVGARYLDAQQRSPHGDMAGALGDVACFSFFSNKNLATAEGGMVTTNRDDLAERLRRLRSHGMTTLTWDRHRGHAHSYDVVAHGFNYRMDELRAALGRVQLAKLEHNNARRHSLVAAYRQCLAGATDWQIPFIAYAGNSAYHLMIVVALDGKMRDAALHRCKAAGIQTSLHYPCIPDFSAFHAYRTADVPISRMFTGRAITLPLYPMLNENEVQVIASTLQSGYVD